MGVRINLANRTNLKKYIELVFKKEGKKLDFINYIFCKDSSMLKVNRQYLHHDFYTDIITFDLSETAVIQAEVYVSIDRVRDNAMQFEATFKSEFHRVIFHGVLHLCGYKDKSKTEESKMRKMEEFYLVNYFK